MSLYQGDIDSAAGTSYEPNKFEVCDFDIVTKSVKSYTNAIRTSLLKGLFSSNTKVLFIAFQKKWNLYRGMTTFSMNA